MNYFFSTGENNTRQVSLQDEFLKWQCRLRQIIVRENGGKPDSSIIPLVHSPHGSWEAFPVITILCRKLHHSVTPEMHHMAKATNDPVQVRDKALKFFAERYYQQPEQFSDTLTATFDENSQNYKKLVQLDSCNLHFEVFNKSYTLACKMEWFSTRDYYWQATYWHNLLFNPNLAPTIKVVGFSPDWNKTEQIQGKK